MLADYTRGRLDADADETERVLAAALAEVRRWCGWHVSPAVGSEITLDGPGGPLLRLPTKLVVELTGIVEDGADIDLDTVQLSRTGLVRKNSGANWTTALGGIVVTMTHGFDEAPDFEAAVLSVADRRSQTPAGGVAVAVGPFRFSEDAPASAFSPAELAILGLYRLERPA